MAKPNFKEILLAKGDKIALGVGGALVALLGLWGVASLATAESPTEKAKQFDAKATALKQSVSSPGAPATELPSWVTKSIDKTKIEPNSFALVGSPFEPVDRPDTLRKNPTVLAIDGAQTEVVRLPMVALDVQRTGTGANDIVVGVVATAKPASTDLGKLRENANNAKKSFLGSPGSRKPSPSTPGTSPPPGGGLPGGSSGGPPGAGGPPSGGFPGGSSGGPPSGGLPGGFGGEGDTGGDGSSYTGGQRTDQTVIYVPFSEVEKKGLPLAETIYPLRAVLVTATFPMKAQLEEIKRALRAKSDAEAAFYAGSNNIPGPSFDGFEVDRRIMPRGSATWSEWAPYDHFLRYFQEIASRKIPGKPDTQDSEYVNYFLRPTDEKLFAPLPPLADRLGEYGKIRLRPILDGVTKLKELNKPIVTQSDWEKRFGAAPGTINPYAPAGGTSASPRGPGGFGPGGGDGDETGPGGRGGLPPGVGGAPIPGGSSGGFPPSGSGSYPPGGGPPGGFPPGTGAGGTLDAQRNPYEINTHTLIRFFDVDVVPGFTYQYRVRMRMKNPNFKQTNLVSKPDDAKVEFLEGPWQDIPDEVKIPVDSYLFAGDPVEYAEKKSDLVKEYGSEFNLKRLLEIDEVNTGKRAVVQIQRWMPQIRIEGSGNKAEPVGTWVVADIPVGPGEYIGKRQLIELPLWSGGLGNYVLRELTGGVKVAGIKDPKNQPKGWPVNFRTSAILIDFDGGKSKLSINGKDVTDQADTEILILQPDGKLSVKNSGEDKKFTDRAEREILWNEWIKRVKQRRDVAVPGGGTSSGSGFGRPGGS